MASVGRNYCVLFAAAIFFCAGNALPRNEPHALLNLLRNVERKVIVEASFDKLVDENLPKIRSAIIANGMDPMELQDISLPVTGLPGFLKGKIRLTDGWLQQFSHLKRAGKSHLSYSDRRLVVEINLGWKNLTFDYKYLFQYLMYKRKGEIHGHVSDADFQIVFVIDFDTVQVELKKIQFKNTGKYELELEGHLTDVFLNSVVKVVTSFAKDFISSKVGDIFEEVGQEKVDEINEILKPKLISY